MEDFRLMHDGSGRLFAIVIIDGKEYNKDVTDYFDKDNAHDDWLDYRIGVKYGV